MRRKLADSSTNMIIKLLFCFLLAISCCDGSRRAQRRKDTSRSAGLYAPEPSAESLQAIAQAMGAAGFEHHTEGRALVKRLIPADSQPDLDVVEHQGVIGRAGVDFPAFPNIPNTGFNCKNVPTGYYADLETDCQVFHICDTSRKISFLCPNGTIFSQSHLICDWWFKVDCASAPALYESSAEYYSNEQKKTLKIPQPLTKTSDLQQLGTDTNYRAESRRTSVNIPSTTERFFRHKQRLQGDAQLSSSKATARSFQALFESSNYNPTQRTQATTAIERRRKNLVQLIANNFGNGKTKSTIATYSEGPVYKPTTATPPKDYNSGREMQIAAESASFAANNNNRQFLNDYNNKNYRPYPVYTPNVPTRPHKTKSNPNLTTLYDFRDKSLDQVTKTQETSTKRSTLVPYPKSYTTPFHYRRDPYTRPGVSLLKDFLERERNKTFTTTTENISYVTDRSDLFETPKAYENKVTIETKNTFESATKIPLTTQTLSTIDTSTSTAERLESYTNHVTQVTAEPYQERRERLIRKLNLGILGVEPTTETTLPTTEKYYGDKPNRPGLVVPPSLTPKTLHSLAIYYATALDNLSTTTPPEEMDATAAFDQYEAIGDELPGLFSRHTINKYSHLFGHGSHDSELLNDVKLDPNGTYNELVDDLSVQQSQNPLATSPQIRELAQVFTHALSAYLQDPVQFRKVLSDIRPTPPSFTDILSTDDSFNTEPTTTINEDDEEILGFSDDIKSRPSLSSLRDGKALNLVKENIATEVPITTHRPYSLETFSTAYTAYSSVTPRNPFKCCAKISASYTSPSTPTVSSTTPVPFTNTVNTLPNNIFNEKLVSTTENSYAIPKYGGFQNNTKNDSPYGNEVNSKYSQPLREYVAITNLPTAWGVDASNPITPSTTTADNTFESKKITTTTTIPETTPVYFTETDSIELENEEELQRAHSQSFLPPQTNSLRQGKQLSLNSSKITVKKPSEDLEAPTLSGNEIATAKTTTEPTLKIDELQSSTTLSPIVSSVFTSPDSEKNNNQFQWPDTFEVWHSTVIDPITLNDGLSSNQPELSSQFAQQTNSWASTTFIPVSEFATTTEQSISSSTINSDVNTADKTNDLRFERLLKDPTSTEPSQDLSAITDTVVEKAKEIMGGMNATTTEKLMNVMKKTKSKTVKRLILLLVQTCDDDHNTTAEASKKALLEALMAVSQKDMEEIAKEEQGDVPATTPDYTFIQSTNYQKSDFENQENISPALYDRRGKSFSFEPNAINSLSNPTIEAVRTTESVQPTEFTFVTTASPARTTHTARRGTKKFYSRTTVAPVSTTIQTVDSPRAEARTSVQEPDLKGVSDTRALELLKSLYTIAARWG
ncbi:hypothetical protein ACJJTC_017145 [Scirpophaga incertulas]